MRIRIIKMFYYSGKGHYHAGDVVDVSDTDAHEYIRKGLAMQDKSVEPVENKAVVPPPPPPPHPDKDSSVYITKIVRRKRK